MYVAWTDHARERLTERFPGVKRKQISVRRIAAKAAEVADGEVGKVVNGKMVIVFIRRSAEEVAVITVHGIHQDYDQWESRDQTRTARLRRRHMLDKAIMDDLSLDLSLPTCF